MKTKHVLALSALAAALATPAAAQFAGPASTEGFRMQALMSDSFETQSSRLALQRSRNPQVRRYAQEMIRDHAASTAALTAGGANYAGGPAGGPIGGLVTAPLAVAGAATGAAVGAVNGTLTGAPVTGTLQGVGTGAAQGAQAFGGDVGTTASAGAAVPPDPRQQAMLEQLAAEPAGARFDRLYGQMQVQSHREAVGAYQAYLQSGNEPSMRNFASANLPNLQAHLAQAQRLPGGRSAQ